MDHANTFSYTYSAKENQEIQNIRSRYLPREEPKLEELKRLDRLVQNSGLVESLCTGIGGALIFGVGFCLTMQVFGSAVWLGVILGLLGAAGMIAAYPVCRKLSARAKARYTPRILQLAEELSGI